MATLTKEDQRALALFADRLRRAFPRLVVAIKVFGSKARGDASNQSDVDVLVILDHGDWRSKHDVYDIAADLLVETGVDLSPTVMTRAEADQAREQRRPFWKSIEQDAVTLTS